MKVLCSRDALSEALSVIATALPSRTTKPVLEAVLIDAKDSHLSLTATDLEVAIRYTLTEVQIEKEGSCLVPAREAADFVRDMSDSTVTLEASRSQLRISGKDDYCDLAVADVGEFAGMPKLDVLATVTLKGLTLAKLLERTVYSAAKEPGRFAMNGVRAEISREVFKAIATDGRRLSIVEQPIDKGPASATAVTIPSKAIQQFLRLLQGVTDDATLDIAAEKIALNCRQATVVCRVLEGEFPRYQAVIPKDGKNSVEFDARQLEQKLRLVAHLCPAEQPIVRLKFASNSLTLSATSPQRGEARAELPVVFKGTTEEIAFNPEYVIDGLKVSEKETVRLEFNDKSAPGRFFLNEHHEYVVMPVVSE
jgi:DNA polymerase-3 subunit beta